MKTGNKIWVVEAHDLGALQVREAGDALTLNRKRWLEGARVSGKQNDEKDGKDGNDRTGKADRLLVGLGGTIDEALEVERELKRMRKEANIEHPTSNIQRPTEDGRTENGRTEDGITETKKEGGSADGRLEGPAV